MKIKIVWRSYSYYKMQMPRAAQTTCEWIKYNFLKKWKNISIDINALHALLIQ